MEDLTGYVELMAERAYSEKTGSMYFCSPYTLSREEAAKVVKNILPKGYGSFTAAKIKLLPKDCRVRIAREYSPCLYVETTKPFERSPKLACDEFNLQQEVNGTLVYRLWWD